MPKETENNSTRSIEQGLRQIYRFRGDLVPTAEEQVAAAERRIEAEAPDVPPVLAQAPTQRLKSVMGVRGSPARPYWTNPSVLTLHAADPVEAITQKARHVVLSAIELGWCGPPYDPSQLAEMLNIFLVPTEDVIDARTRSVGGRYCIEFNPMRPAARLRYSLAHEIGHTLFPDCAQAIRNRATHEQMKADEWQLEMLCNVAASEILMPIGSLPSLDEFVPTADSVLQLRRRFQASCEAVLLRLLRLTAFKCFAFAAHRDLQTDRYRVDYVVSSAGFREAPSVRAGHVLPKGTRAAECTAIGYTAKGQESWLTKGGDWEVEYLGIAPFPQQTFPRVLGIVRATDPSKLRSNIRFLKGNASEPRGKGTKIILQIVNDKALTWGFGFARTIRNNWPAAQKDFSEWAVSRRREFRLGAVHVARLREDLLLASLVAQHGYGPSDKPRIRYVALEQCLLTVADTAKQLSATVHLPRIGTGQAGGVWTIVEEIIQQTLCSQQLDVTVYDLPNQQREPAKQPSLFDIPADSDQFI